VNNFAGLNYEEVLILIYPYKQTHQGNKPKKAQEKKNNIKENISNITERMECCSFYLACITLKDYFHKTVIMEK